MTEINFPVNRGPDCPTVSVIVPCFNQGEYLGDALDSAIMQTYRKFEVLVIDDGSNDETAIVAARFPEVSYLRQCHRGVSAARNLGIRQSSGQFVVFLDADDRLLPHALEIGVTELSGDSECAFVCGRFERITATGKGLFTGKPPLITAEHYRHFLNRNFISPASVMFRRDSLQWAGGFNSSLEPCEDYDLYLRITRVLPILCHDRVVAQRRIHDRQATKDNARMLRQSLKVHGRQWPFVKNDTDLRNAFLNGQQHYREWYGEQLVTEIHLLQKRGRWWKALFPLISLLRYYPEGFLRSFKGLRRSNSTTFKVLDRALSALANERPRPEFSIGGASAVALELVGLNPSHTVVGCKFAPLADGRSVLRVHGRRVSRSTTVIFDEKPLDTVCRDEDVICAAVPDELISREGSYEVYLLK